MDFFEIDKNQSNREFLIKASPFLVEKPFLSIPARTKIKAQELAVHQLKVKDIFQLRDRFEGQAYLDNLFLKLASREIVERYFLNNKNYIETYQNETELSTVQINFEPTTIIPFYYGSLPIVRVPIENSLLFVSIRTDHRSGIICGAIGSTDYNNNEIWKGISGVYSDRKMMFIGFEKLRLPEVKSDHGEI